MHRNVAGIVELPPQRPQIWVIRIVKSSDRRKLRLVKVERDVLPSAVACQEGFHDVSCKLSTTAPIALRAFFYGYAQRQDARPEKEPASEFGDLLPRALNQILSPLLVGGRAATLVFLHSPGVA